MIERQVAMLLLASLVACTSDNDKLGNDAAKLAEFKPAAGIETRWHYEAGDAGNNGLVPAVMPDAVYAANAQGKLFRLDRATGKRVWRADTDFPVSAGVGTGSGLVLVGGVKGELAAFAEDGTLRWKTKVTSEVLSAPQIAEGVVVVRTADGRISGLAATDGQPLWLYERATPALIVRSHSGVTIDHGTVYAGFAGGKLAAISLSTGLVIWETAVSQARGSTELERISDIISVPVVDEHQVCAVAFQGRLACYALAQGSLLWSRELSSDKGMALLGDSLYLTDATGVVLSLDKNSGSSIWKNDQLSLRRTSAPLVLGKHLLVGDYEGYLHVLNLDDGSLEARLKTNSSPIMVAPVELDGGVLLQTQDGDVYSVAIHELKI